MRFNLALLFIFCAIGSWAQFVQLPIVHKAGSGKAKNTSAHKNISARIQQQQDSILTLPFWDDFSFVHNDQHDSLSNYPDSLWQFGHSVWINSGMGINPPTIGVATFDGLDSTGLPYNVNNSLAKGIADRLTSKPLRLDLVSPADSIFIFFYYQYEGRGEPPDPGDNLSLLFRDSTGVWDVVWTIGLDSTSNNTKFIPVKIPIDSPIYFYNGFQFRFQNFARLSGPFDTWNLDYVYINNGKKQYLPVYGDFPDRAVATPLSSAFLQYQSMPAKHFLTNPDSLLTYPSIPITNLRSDQTVAANYPQPVNLDAYLTRSTRLKKVLKDTTYKLDHISALPVFYGVATQFNLDNKPSFEGVDPKTDSIGLSFHIKLNPSDTVKKISTTVGDYDTVAYKGINFRVNDTISTSFVLKNYYAYDDGGAEYAVTLTQPGAYVAYEYDMVCSYADTLIALDVYFPHVGDESSQDILISVWNKLNTPQIDSLIWNVQRTVDNTFVRIPLDFGILVKDKFFVGWKQGSTAAIGIGFDKDSDSGNKIFYNTVGIWMDSSGLHGNLMIRPVFGNLALGITTGVEETITYAYPNPNRGVFYLPSSSQNLQVIDVTGRRVLFQEEDFFDKKQVAISNPSSGLYLARYFNGTRWRTEKIMVMQ